MATQRWSSLGYRPGSSSTPSASRRKYGHTTRRPLRTPSAGPGAVSTAPVGVAGCCGSFRIGASRLVLVPDGRESSTSGGLSVAIPVC